MNINRVHNKCLNKKVHACSQPTFDSSSFDLKLYFSFCLKIALINSFEQRS